MASGAAFRGLAMPSFMENTARQISVMKDKGVFFGPIDPDNSLRFTATRDMATAAAPANAREAAASRQRLATGAIGEAVSTAMTTTISARASPDEAACR